MLLKPSFPLCYGYSTYIHGLVGLCMHMGIFESGLTYRCDAAVVAAVTVVAVVY